jgi:5'-3' exonuclease
LQQYLYGLQWIACSRFGQLSDWQWYYPYGYAPEPSDFAFIAEIKLESHKKTRKPFSSLEHLLTVQKPKQTKGVPAAFHVNTNLKNIISNFIC